MTRDDVERIIENVLGELKVVVINGDFTDPNRRTIKLMYGKKEISEASLDVSQRDEYEG